MAEEITGKQLIIEGVRIVRYLLRQWKWVFLGGLLGASIGLFMSISSKPKYQGEVTFVLEESSSASAYASIASQFGISLGGGSGSSNAFTVDNIIGLLQSRKMIENTLLKAIEVEGKQQTLAEHYIALYDYRSSWEAKPWLAGMAFPVGLKKEDLTPRQDSILSIFHQEMLANNLSINKLSDKMSILAISCKSTDQYFSKYFVDFLLDEVSKYYIATKTKKNKTNFDLLQNRADSAKRELDKALYGRALANDQNQFIVRQRASLTGIKKEIDVQVLSAMYTELIKNLEITRLTLLQETPLIERIDTTDLPLKQSKLSKRKGVMIGGIIGGFLVSLILIVVLAFKHHFSKSDFSG